MERPTCETCPYLDRWDQPNAVAIGDCHRHAPAPGDHLYTETYAPSPRRQWEDSGQASWKFVHEDDWCGEHPDFPEYLASLKRQSPPAIAAGKYVGLGVRERKAIWKAEGMGLDPGLMTLDDWMQIKNCGITTANKLVSKFKEPPRQETSA